MEAGVQLIKRYPLLNISHPQVIFHILECATHVSFRQNFGHQPILNRFMLAPQTSISMEFESFKAAY